MDKKTKDDRLYLRIKGELKRKAEGWARRRNTTLSEVVTRFFENLLEHERKELLSKESAAAKKIF
ncbi:MAG: DUF6364 family protein [Candidatus Neomarinimicrobiota bacterium]|jgi:hypothetical protein